MKLFILILLFSGGIFFFSVGTIGLLRLPDFFTRAHSTTKADTLGAVLSLSGLMVYSGFNMVSLKLLVVIIFLLVTNPTATHIIAMASYKKKDNGGVKDNEDI